MNVFESPLGVRAVGDVASDNAPLGQPCGGMAENSQPRSPSEALRLRSRVTPILLCKVCHPERSRGTSTRATCPQDEHRPLPPPRRNLQPEPFRTRYIESSYAVVRATRGWIVLRPAAVGVGPPARSRSRPLVYRRQASKSGVRRPTRLLGTRIMLASTRGLGGGWGLRPHREKHPPRAAPRCSATNPRDPRAAPRFAP